MNYGMSFSEALEALENDLAAFDEMGKVMEAISMTLNTQTQQAQKSNATDSANNSMTDTTSNNSTQDFVEQVQAMSAKTTKTLERNHNSILRTLNNTWESNQAFIEQYQEMVNQYKLLDEYTAINWSYGHNPEQYLHAKVTKLRAVINTNLAYLNNLNNIPENALISKAGTALDKLMVTEMGAPSSIDTPKEFMGHLRSQFRGRKSEKIYRGEMANAFIQDVRSFAKTKTSYSQDITAAERMIKTLESSCLQHMRNSSMDDSSKKRVIVLQRNASRMITLYISMIYFTYRLHVEYILNKRTIISRLFEK